MRRTILISSLVITAAIALLVGAGTFAQFTDTASISGDVQAGKLEMTLVDSATSASDTEITFDPSTVCGNMAPGQTCTATMAIGHTASSSLEFTYTGDVKEAGDTSDNCFSAALSDFANSNTTTAPALVSGTQTNNGTQATFGHSEATDGTDVTDALDPTETDSMLLTVTFNASAGNECQGVGPVTYTVSATATQSSTPQD
ncbi:MAG TPA: SipW-dependent-type signal peptide-containing protein [Dehalococcoidia bacterium]|nr:SipW-dependent-type signal peptide-containing protein [Dehalococcoidia bacterium]